MTDDTEIRWCSECADDTLWVADQMGAQECSRCGVVED